LLAALALLLVPMVHGTEKPASPLNPPFEFPPGEATSRIEFQDASQGAAIYSASIFEDAKTCRKRHEVVMDVSNTLTVPAGAEVSFLVAYHEISYPTVSWCAAVFTLTPDGSDYLVQSDIPKDAKTCRFVVLKKTDTGLVKADEARERTLRKPFIDGWCK
jgi:hypothetical protein